MKSGRKGVFLMLILEELLRYFRRDNAFRCPCTLVLPHDRAYRMKCQALWSTTWAAEKRAEDHVHKMPMILLRDFMTELRKFSDRQASMSESHWRQEWTTLDMEYSLHASRHVQSDGSGSLIGPWSIHMLKFGNGVYCCD